MAITSVSMRGFRCFTRYDLELDPHITLITGPNGVGKSSLLEALFVGATLRSFRTPLLRELIGHTTEAFSLKMVTAHDTIHVGYGSKSRIVEINGRSSATRRELMTLAPVVVLAEEDLLLVQGSPEGRRGFIDSVAAALESDYRVLFRKYQQVMRSRNALLMEYQTRQRDVYELLTMQLWQLGAELRNSRIAALAALQVATAALLYQIVPHAELKLEYVVATQERGMADALAWCARMERREAGAGRTLCGPHLDDMEIRVSDTVARRFASRGTQKLVVVLLKIAYAAILGPETSFLLDDVMADFDEQRLHAVLALLLKTGLQSVITVPTYNAHVLADALRAQGASLKHIELL